MATIIATVKDLKLSIKDTTDGTGFTYTFSEILNDADADKILALGKAFNSIQRTEADKYIKTVVTNLVKVG